MGSFDTSDFNKRLQDLMKSFPEKLAERIENACLTVENSAKRFCPVDDGILRASISHQVETNADEVSGFIGSNLDYAPYVHQGTGLYSKSGNGRKSVPWTYRTADGKFYKTKGQKANPFLMKAIDSNRQEILEYLKGVLSE